MKRERSYGNVGWADLMDDVRWPLAAVLVGMLVLVGPGLTICFGIITFLYLAAATRADHEEDDLQKQL